jgi:transposase
MGKPYSLDLRKRVVSAIEGGMSRNQAAKQFGVAISTAIGWMQRVEETGSVEPGRYLRSASQLAQPSQADVFCRPLERKCRATVTTS